MVPRTKPVRVKGWVRFKNAKGLVYETPAVKVADAQKPSPVRVFTAPKLPTPFWSREGNVHKCTIPLDVDPADIDKAELHVSIWDGGAGTTKEPFTLNGEPLAVAGKGKHDVLYRVVEKVTCRPAPASRERPSLPTGRSWNWKTLATGATGTVSR